MTNTAFILYRSLVDKIIRLGKPSFVVKIEEEIPLIIEQGTLELENINPCEDEWLPSRKIRYSNIEGHEDTYPLIQE